jgi:hypothetical protein
MRSPAHRRFMVVLILLVLSVPTSLFAAPAREAQPAPAKHAEGGFLDLVQSVIFVLWGENGSILDPSGGRLAGDNGPGLGPDGNGLTGDNGSILDPSGRS